MAFARRIPRGPEAGIYKALRLLTLKPAKKLQLRFDPFGGRAASIREFLFFISAEKYRLTNPKCLLKTDVVNDRCEPQLLVTLSDEKKVIFETGNLTTLELFRLFNEHVSSLYQPPPEEETVASFGTGKKKPGKKK